MLSLHAVGWLLLAAVAGYWVLERAEAHKDSLRKVGRFLGWVVIIGSLVGATCALVCPAGKGFLYSKGAWCPFSGKQPPSPQP